MEVAARMYAGIIFPDVNSKIEPHLSATQKAMLDATPDCIKVLSVDGKLVTMNRAGCLALNVPVESEFGMPWLPLLPEQVHELGLAALHQAAKGHNARFPGQSESDGIRYWDNLLTPIVDNAGQVQSILCVSRDVTEKIRIERELEAAIHREKLLSREMHHRIKNLFTVVSALISISEKEAASLQSPARATKILREKLQALGRASDAAFADRTGEHFDTKQIELGSLVQLVLKPYGDRFQANGCQIYVGSAIMTMLALFLHELATNSVKYGAFSADDGLVSVQWNSGESGLYLSWIEEGGPKIEEAPLRQGFGSEMVDHLVQSAGGTVNRSWRSQGLVTELHLPLSALI